jgi:hypothetical protein
MGDVDPVGSIERNPYLTASQKQSILEENAPRLLGLI